MNKDEYFKRIDNMHSFTGIPSYWQDLQDAIREKQIANAMRAFHEEEAKMYKEMYEQALNRISTLEAESNKEDMADVKYLLSEGGRQYLLAKVADLEAEIELLKGQLHELAHKAEEFRIRADENAKLSEYWQGRAI